MEKRFGTISGVFIPNTLTIFGVILFYREGWVVGNLGIFGALAIILLANFVTLTSAFSMSSIATNIRVKGGGSYYMTSRSLGPEIGGAFGLAEYFASTFSISFYIIGFVTTLQLFTDIPAVYLNYATLLLVMLIVIISANIAIKLQYVIFALVIGGIISYFFANFNYQVPEQWVYAPKDASFWETFAIFFPAVTGIFSGLSLSGDLKDPNRNLPRGTIGAILFTLVIYIILAFSLGMNFPREVLLGNDKIMIDHSLIPGLVIAGVFASTISSAIGMCLGAPRILQALARDGIVPKFLGKGSGKTDEPRVAILISVIITAPLLLQGSLDFVAQILTMFFLATYGIINFIIFLEYLIGNPTFRPTFKVPVIISLLGGIAAITAMFLIDKWATLVALVIIFCIFYVLYRRRLQKDWGDMRQGIWAHLMEVGSKAVIHYGSHPRNWRPYITVFENDSRGRLILTSFAFSMAGKAGFIFHYLIRKGNLMDEKIVKDSRLEQEAVRSYFISHGYTNIVSDIILSNGGGSQPVILQIAGMGPLKANTVLTDFYLSEPMSLQKRLSNVPIYRTLRKNMILLRTDAEFSYQNERIDVWISGFKNHFSLLLLIPTLLVRSKDWEGCKVCIKMIVSSEDEVAKRIENLHNLIQNARLDAEIQVFYLQEEYQKIMDHMQENKEPAHKTSWLFNFLFKEKEEVASPMKKIQTIIGYQSKDARLVVLGLKHMESGEEEQMTKDLVPFLRVLPQTALVSGGFDVNIFS